MTTTTAPATTARSITTEVRRALRLAGVLGHALKVSTQESIDNRRDAAGRVEQVRTWRTLVETFSHTKDVADALTAAGYTVFSKSEQPGSQQFVALTAPRVAEVDTTPTAGNPETNTHHVKYTNVGGYDGTVLIERGDNRRTQALEQAASIRRSGGHVHEIIEITSRGRRITVVEPIPAADQVERDFFTGSDEDLADSIAIVQARIAKMSDPELVKALRRERVRLLRVQAARALPPLLAPAVDSIRITGAEAREIRQHVAAYVRPDAVWAEVQTMRECAHGCKLYVHKVGDALRFALMHYAGYGCRRDAAPVPVLVD